MAITEIHIYNTKTGNVRVVDYHEMSTDDDQATRAMHDKHKPLMHIDLQIGEDEIVSYRL